MARNWITENWGAKLAALGLALVLWYYVLGEESVEITRTIPVEIKVEDEKMSVVGTSTRLVLATLQAPRSLLTNLTSEEIKAEHRIKDVKSPGEYSFRLEPQEIQLPSGQIRVAKIEPEAIQVKIDEMIVQKMEIEPGFLGEPAFGYRLEPGEVQLDPNAVLVEGPKSQLEKLGKIKTRPIDLVGRSRSFRKTIRLAEEPGLKILTESLVDAYVPIREIAAEKTFEKLPVKILGTLETLSRISVEPSQVALVLQGPSKNLEAVTESGILAYVDISGLEEGTHELALRTLLPEGTSLKGSPPPIKVAIERKKGGIFSAP